MTLIQEMGYAAYGVRDLERTVEFFRNVCQLEVTECVGSVVFLSGDTRHRPLAQVPRDPGADSIAERPVPRHVRKSPWRSICSEYPT